MQIEKWSKWAHCLGETFALVPLSLRFSFASDTGHKFSQSDSILSVSGAAAVAAPLVLARL